MRRWVSLGLQASSECSWDVVTAHGVKALGVLGVAYYEAC